MGAHQPRSRIWATGTSRNLFVVGTPLHRSEHSRRCHRPHQAHPDPVTRTAQFGSPHGERRRGNRERSPIETAFAWSRVNYHRALRHADERVGRTWLATEPLRRAPRWKQRDATPQPHPYSGTTPRLSRVDRRCSRRLGDNSVEALGIGRVLAQNVGFSQAVIVA